MWKLEQTLTEVKTSRFSTRLMMPALLSLLLAATVFSTTASADGIKVHGNWVVTVSNPDGTVAQQREFQNALTDGGQSILVGLLAGFNVVQNANDIFFPTNRAPGVRAWDIEVAATGIVDSAECNAHLTAGSDFSTAFPLLEASVSEASPTSFTLSRNLAVAADCLTGSTFVINLVRSAIDVQSYYEGSEFESRAHFSEKTLDAPITGILPDQVVTLKVTYNFE